MVSVLFSVFLGCVPFGYYAQIEIDLDDGTEHRNFDNCEKGCYINGLSIEGAGWNIERNALVKSNNLQEPLPILHIIPMERHKLLAQVCKHCGYNIFIINSDFMYTNAVRLNAVRKRKEREKIRNVNETNTKIIHIYIFCTE